MASRSLRVYSVLMLLVGALVSAYLLLFHYWNSHPHVLPPNTSSLNSNAVSSDLNRQSAFDDKHKDNGVISVWNYADMLHKRARQESRESVADGETVQEMQGLTAENKSETDHIAANSSNGNSSGLSDGGKEDPIEQPVSQTAGEQSPESDENASSAGSKQMSTQFQTSDKWPQFTKDYFPNPVPESPFKPNFTIKWDFNISAFLQRPEIRGQPPKLMTWMVKTRFTPPLPEPVRLRVCPEMPCRMTTNVQLKKDSAALLWAGQLMTAFTPPVRSHPDQVYLFHNHEPQKPDWIHRPSFRRPAWKSAFNWTMTYRSDSDIVDLYGKLIQRTTPVQKNYTAILAKKTKMAAQLVSNCATFGRREDYIRKLKKHIDVDAFGQCSKLKCPRSSDDSCFQKFSTEYKFYLSFENSFCKDYISEKFFRYMEADLVVVTRGSNDYKDHAPPGTYINTADFRSPKELADYLNYLDSNPDEYIKILKAKDQYQPLYEDWPIRDSQGHVQYMTYHYSAVAWCDVCRRLWELDTYRKTIPDFVSWFDKHNCVPPTDLSQD